MLSTASDGPFYSFHFISTMEDKLTGWQSRKTGGEAAEEYRVLWITNFAAPYRMPVWRQLAERYSLEVAVLVGSEHFHLDGKNRGDEWAPKERNSDNFSIKVLRSRRVSRITRPVYLLASSMTIRQFPSAGNLILGGWQEPAYWQALMTAKIKGIRTIGFYESTPQSQTHKVGLVAGARKFFFRSLDAVVVPGPSAAMAVRKMGVKDTKIFEGFNAVDVAAFHEARWHRSEKKREGHKFLYVGRLIGLKNVASIISAFHRIRLPNDTLTIVGEGELRANLREQADSLGLGNQVVFLGPVAYAALPQVMVQHDTLVLSSLSEVWGLVVNEALAAGLHCVVGQRCGVAASVESMRGVYISDVDIESLAISMASSREAWTGPIDTPEIMSNTPEAFAAVFEAALGAGTKRNT
ncbi:hypothetical protein ASH00_11665 [Arthrobacter sp. Soil782]|nr:hypothetical protein ASH00_11665 [Arthrobacter sp. Soil782]